MVRRWDADEVRKPMRSLQFAKDEALFAARRIKKVGSLNGQSPDVETEV
jgi:hypothetical protein